MDRYKERKDDKKGKKLGTIDEIQKRLEQLRNNTIVNNVNVTQVEYLSVRNVVIFF
jgi:hypothetical protein